FPFAANSFAWNGRTVSSSRHVGRGMRWTLAASGGFLAGRNAWQAGDEVVWSWRRDPGVKLVERSASDGGKRGSSPGEHEGNRKTIARRKPGCLGCTCSSTPVPFFARGLRAQSAPGFPCALAVERDNEMQQPGRKRAAGMRVYVCTVIASEATQST